MCCNTKTNNWQTMKCSMKLRATALKLGVISLRPLFISQIATWSIVNFMLFFHLDCFGVGGCRDVCLFMDIIELDGAWLCQRSRSPEIRTRLFKITTRPCRGQFQAGTLFFLPNYANHPTEESVNLLMSEATGYCSNLSEEEAIYISTRPSVLWYGWLV